MESPMGWERMFSGSDSIAGSLLETQVGGIF